MYQPLTLFFAALQLFLLIVDGHLDLRLAPPPSLCDRFLDVLVSCSVSYCNYDCINSTQQTCLCEYTDHNQDYEFDDAIFQCQQCLSTSANCCTHYSCADCTAKNSDCDYNSFSSQVDSWSTYCSSSSTSIHPSTTSEAPASAKPDYAAEIAIGSVEGALALSLLGLGAFCLKKRRLKVFTAPNERDGHTSQEVL